MYINTWQIKVMPYHKVSYLNLVLSEWVRENYPWTHQRLNLDNVYHNDTCNMVYRKLQVYIRKDKQHVYLTLQTQYSSVYKLNRFRIL